MLSDTARRVLAQVHAVFVGAFGRDLHNLATREHRVPAKGNSHSTLR